MPAIIIKRKSVALLRSTLSEPLFEVSSDTPVLVVVKDDQVEVYTDQEAQDKLSEG